MDSVENGGFSQNSKRATKEKSSKMAGKLGEAKKYEIQVIHLCVCHHSWQLVWWCWHCLIKFDFQVKGLLDYRAILTIYEHR